ncbi:motility associated factor glycosyltransferase family protein [Shinella zoogloeoides]|uniref:DUF115 domain-containing protein n=1 Tax=Shinella zoogloeoides TaxID=352475 RepID=A0A6N8THJ1_SHIZO|nr:6-hydroxymethylpterin diphosphokinase MptE-like protein [Shinella zoogloeoides]MXO02737.1 DUF115 domain-containing protein [Shinella zoogloeoides]UEX80994.1 DUF115 domain-containing protein [Shinella zoogloeoides]
MSYFELHEKINRVLYRAFNVASDAVFWMNRDLHASLGRNKKYKNLHKGERCFIIGTGPSLKKIPAEHLAFLSSECVFGVNSMYKSDILDHLRPSYYSLFDNQYWIKEINEFSEIINKYISSPPVFITDIRARDCIRDDLDCVFVYSKNYPESVVRYDLSSNVSSVMNVVSYSIISAMYMGFREIYLLGCDYNLFCSRMNNHCYSDALDDQSLPTYNLAFYLKYYHITTEIHYLIAKLAKENHIKIVNLTDGSLLDAYPMGGVSDFL